MIQDGNNAKVTVPVYNGVVSVAFEAVAKDGITKDIHSVHVMRYADILEGFKKIDVNRNVLDISEGKIDLGNKTNKISVNAEANDVNAQITVMKRNNNGLEEIAQGVDTVVENGDEIIVRIIHENKRMMEFKTLTVENSKEPELDIKSLLDLIKEAENIDLSNKTEESKTRFLEVLNEVKAKVDEGITSSDELEELIDKLQKAINGLEDKEEKPNGGSNDEIEDNKTESSNPPKTGDESLGLLVLALLVLSGVNIILMSREKSNSK